MRTPRWLLGIFCFSQLLPVAQSDDAIDFFEAKIRPLLAKHCYECHSVKHGVVESDFNLDTRSSLLKGGDRGSAVVAGDPQKSLLFNAVQYSLGDLEMPPSGKLNQEEIDLLSRWIRDGAAMPDGEIESLSGERIDIDASRDHWAFRALSQPVTRFDRGQRMNPVDRWMLHYRKTQRLSAVGVASPETLVRRLSFNLTGLAPRWEDVNAYRNNPSAEAYNRLVTKYLDSPQYGERWARHWLDLVRYTDTTARWLESTAGAFRYRDWVIGAFNDDMPYDQFVKRQFAADFLPDSDNEDLAALGMLGLSPTYWKEPRLAPDVIKTVVAEEWEERIDMVGRTFLGLSLACARCHDHKMDPITQQDYYALAGVFASTRSMDIPLVSADQQKTVRAAIKQAAELRTRIAREKLILQGAKDKSQPTKNNERLESELAELSKSTPNFNAPRIRAVVEDSIEVLADGPDLTKVVYTPDHSVNVALQLRGNPSTPGEIVPRRFIELLDEQKTPFTLGSGRLELAEALVGSARGLLARVMVNRVWRHHFGEGLVSTPSNFGLQGAPPTHPLLLDELAFGLVQHDWSIKWLQRTIVNSDTFKMGGGEINRNMERDPSNQWYWRMNRRQHDIEAWRDSMLQVCGLLDKTMGGESISLTIDENNRRTIYATIKRRELENVLKMFGFPEPTGHSPKRETVNTPLQQLYSLNSRFIWRCATHLAQEFADDVESTDREIVVQLYQRVFSRSVSPEELELGVAFLQSADEDALKRYVHALLISNEFAFLD